MKKLTTFIITSMLWVGCTNPPHESDKLTLGLVQATVIKGANQTEITKVLGTVKPKAAPWLEQDFFQALSVPVEPANLLPVHHQNHSQL